MTMREIRYPQNYDIDMSGFTHIGIGDEGCPIKCLYELTKWEKSETVMDDEIKLVIVTPRVPEKHMENLIENVVRFCNKNRVESIVVNDYGVLYELFNRIGSDSNFILGRTLARSNEYSPWSDYLLRSENADAKKMLKRPNIIHTSKIELLKNYGVSAVELCRCDKLSNYVEDLQKNDIDVIVHKETTIASFGRVCTIHKNSIMSDELCGEKCKSPVELELSKIWGVNKMMLSEPSKFGKSKYPKLKVFGNVVLYASEIENETMKNVRYVYDGRIGRKREA